MKKNTTAEIADEFDDPRLLEFLGENHEELAEIILHPEFEPVTVTTHRLVLWALEEGLVRRVSGKSGLVADDRVFRGIHLGLLESFVEGVPGADDETVEYVCRTAALTLAAERGLWNWEDLRREEEELLAPLWLKLLRARGITAWNRRLLPLHGNEMETEVKLVAWWARTQGRWPEWLPEE